MSRLACRRRFLQFLAGSPLFALSGLDWFEGLRSPSPLGIPLARQRSMYSGKGCASLATRRARTLSSSSGGRRGGVERFPDLAAELVRLKVDLIVAPNVPAARAAKQATNTIPIVVAAMHDPVRDGLVQSLARPGGNITGLTFLGPELVPKLLELLKEAVPRVSRVAALLHLGAYAEPTMRDMLKETEVAARALRVQLQLVRVGGANDFDSAFSAMTREHADAFVVLPSPMLFGERGRIVDLAAKHRLPAIYLAREFVELGGLMAYGASIRDLFRRSATQVDKILKGAKPADLPVEQPTKFELVINLKTAKALGLTIPRSLLLRADEVIQ